VIFRHVDSFFRCEAATRISIHRTTAPLSRFGKVSSDMRRLSSMRRFVHVCLQTTVLAPRSAATRYPGCRAERRSVWRAGLSRCVCARRNRQGSARSSRRAAAATGPASYSWRKRPQSSAPLKFSGRPDETRDMPLPLSPSPSPSSSRDARQLVFTSSQAARYLGVSLATIRRWTDAGHISCYRTPGGQRRFSRDQLDDFIASMHRDGPAIRSEIHAHSASVA
jgi:excisionase family DNA binding protein